MESEKNIEAPGPGPEQAAPRTREEAAPLTVGDYIVMFIVFSLPVVNLILALVWGFGAGANPNRRNFARAWLIILLIGIVLAILAGIVAAVAARSLMPMLQEFFESF